MSNERKKPLLWSADPIEEAEKSLAQTAALRATDDPNHIPGYSEQIRAQDLAKAEYGSMAYQQREHQLRQLGIDEVRAPTVHFKPVRVGMGGEMSDSIMVDLATYQSQGYRFATVEDFERHGYALPPLYHVAADGKIRRGDVAFMVVDAARAKAVRAEKDALTKERETGGETVGHATGVQIRVDMARDPDFAL